MNRGFTTKKLSAIIIAVIGIAIIVMGACYAAEASSYRYGYSHDAGYHDVPDAAFGADFYTYMYDASDTIVTELNQINNAMEDVVSAESRILSATAESVKMSGMLMVSIGLAVLAFGVKCLGDEFEIFNGKKSKPAQYTAPAEEISL